MSGTSASISATPSKARSRRNVGVGAGGKSALGGIGLFGANSDDEELMGGCIDSLDRKYNEFYEVSN